MADPAAAELDTARALAGMYCAHPPEVVSKCWHCWDEPGTGEHWGVFPYALGVCRNTSCYCCGTGPGWGYRPAMLDRAMRWQCSACCAELRAKAQAWNAEWMARGPVWNAEAHER